MKTSTLVQSSLLAASLLLGGTSAVHADRAHSTMPSGGHYHSLPHDKRSSGHTSQWSSGHHKPGGAYFSDHGEHHGKHNPKRHENHRQANGYDQGRRWQHGKHDGWGDGRDHKGQWQYGKHNGRGEGRDHKDYWQHGKYDGRDDAGHKEYRSRFGGIGYTGRS